MMRKILILLLSGLLVAGCAKSKETETASPSLKTMEPTKTISVEVVEDIQKTKTELVPTVASITVEPTQIETGEKEVSFDHPIIYIDEMGSGFVYLQDIVTGEYRILGPKTEIRELIGWEPDGCGLTILMHDLSIVSMDLKGNIQETLFSTVILPPDAQDYNVIPEAILSPDKEWVLYWVGRGEIFSGLYESRQEVEDIEVISVDGSSGPYRISQSGGAWKGIWSPDNTHLAYTDYDENGIHQLFLSNREGKDRVQLTKLTNPKIEIRQIIFSPDGEWIAFLFREFSKDLSLTLSGTLSVGLVSIQQPINSVKIFDEMRPDWWQDNKTLVSIGKLKEGEYGFIWLDAESGERIKSWSNEYEGYWSQPFGSTKKIAFLFNDPQYKFMVYDIEKDEYEVLDKVMFIDLDEWSVSPEAFKGESFCEEGIEK